MEITSAEFLEITSAEFLPNPLGQSTTILAVVNGVNVFVPTVPGNRHYIELMRQVAEGSLVIEGEL